jgi:preprotein translocase subunit SecG
MMGFFIGLLTLVLVLDCIILILLVLLQLPKKDAGAGLAFGGGASDALFGAGAGTVLTKITKYAATGFFVLALFLSIVQGRYHNRGSSTFQRNLMSGSPPAPVGLPAATPTPGQPAGPVTTTNAVPAIPAEAPSAPATAPGTPVAPTNATLPK